MLKKLLKKMLAVLCPLLILSGCEKYVDGTTAYGFLGIVSDDEKAQYAADLIVKAFDTKDKELLKSILHDYVIQNDDELDSEIDKAFSFYQGTSTTYETYKNGSRSIKNGNVYSIMRPMMYVNTNKNKYLISFVYSTKNTDNPNDVGIYNIEIYHLAFFWAYYGEEKGDSLEELENEISGVTKLKWIKEKYDDVDPTSYGIGVFAGDETTMRELYYEKNGKEMVLYAVDKESREFLQDENGNLIEVPEDKSVYLEDLPELE